MNKFISLSLSILILNGCYEMSINNPPKPKKTPYKLEAHGDIRIDDYYWMRDDTRSDPELISYLESENDYFQNWRDSNIDYESSIYKELKSMIPDEEETLRVKDGSFYYYSRIKANEQYSTYYRNSSNEEILLDVNKEAEGKEFYNVAGLNISPDENLLLYGEDLNGRREYTLRIKNLKNNSLLEDEIVKASPSAIWSNDSEYIIYAKKDEETLIQNQIYLHKLGTNQDEDKLIYKESDNEFNIWLSESRTKKYIYVYIEKTNSSEVWLMDKSDPLKPLELVLKRSEGHLYSVEDGGDYFYALSNHNDAKNFKVMRFKGTDFNDIDKWQNVLDDRETHYIEDMLTFTNHIVIQSRFDGIPIIEILDINSNKLSQIKMNDEVYDLGLAYNNDFNSSFFRYSYSSLKTTPQIYKYDLYDDENKVVWKKQVNNFLDTNYEVKRIKTLARDKTEVPVSIVYKKGVDLETAPLLIYGYGSYGINMDSGFRSSITPLLNRGFIFAIAQIRGGADMGRYWYEDGRMMKKNNTFFDFIDATKFLIENGIGNPEKLFATGGSAGGLLMGAVINYEPELYKGIVSAVPFVDVLTTMSDESIPLTTFEYDEWGNPENKDEYMYMKTYSPYDNIYKANYPSVLVTTSLFDSQVQYFEPAKYVPKLRENSTSGNPIFLSINLVGGHGGRSGRLESLKEIARDYSFILNIE
ncbi:MAG: S9 family peptidase [Pseudomonadota bacterium]|nr:S9 family peptidase [Pseudomonadota bacterium]